MPRKALYDVEILERLKAGEKIADIVVSMGVNEKTVYNAMKRAKMNPPTLTRLTEAQQADVLARRSRGETVDSIVAATGVSRRSIYNVVDRKNAPKRAFNKLTIEQENEFVQRYTADNETVIAISADYPVHVQTLHNILDRHGIAIRAEHARVPRIDNTRRAEIVAACVDGGLTSVAAAEKFGVSQEAVLKFTGLAGVRLKKGRPKIYEVDESAFDLYTPESLYWLGFIFADGCVHETRLIVCLADVDVGHLEKLRSFLKATYPIRYTDSVSSFNSDSRFVWLSPRSARMTNMLKGRGITPKRTRFPTPEMAASRDFWRGAIDGDGNFGVSSFNGYMYPYISLAGQKPLLDSFRDFVRQNGIAAEINSRKAEGKAMFNIGTSGSKAGEIIRLLYADSSVALTRKLIRSEHIMAGNTEKSTPYHEGPSARRAQRELVAVADAAEAEEYEDEDEE